MAWIVVNAGMKKCSPAVAEKFGVTFSDPKQEAEFLAKRGYAVVSRKRNIVARVDNAHWRQELVSKRLPVCADWYRRVKSKDNIKVSGYVLAYMPKSGNFRGPNGDVVWDGK